VNQQLAAAMSPQRCCSDVAAAIASDLADNQLIVSETEPPTLKRAESDGSVHQPRRTPIRCSQALKEDP
jgi:hypothetical protein